MATSAISFDVGDYVVYPKHGVGRVIELQNQEIAGMQLELYVLRFEKEKMTLRVPVNKAENRSLYASREAIHPKEAHGRFRRFKWAMVILLLGIYYVAPWLRWTRPRPACAWAATPTSAA